MWIERVFESNVDHNVCGQRFSPPTTGRVPKALGLMPCTRLHTGPGPVKPARCGLEAGLVCVITQVRHVAAATGPSLMLLEGSVPQACCHVV